MLTNKTDGTHVLYEDAKDLIKIEANQLETYHEPGPDGTVARTVYDR